MSVERIIDADGHILEVEDAFRQSSNPDLEYEELKELIPPPFDSRSWRVFPPYDHLHIASSTKSGAFKRRGPKEWVSSMDQVGISKSMLYPTLGLAYGQTQDEDWAILISKIYNKLLYKTYLAEEPRLQGMGMVPFQDLDAAIEELNRVVGEFKMPGIVLPPSDELGKKKEFWAIYEEANRLGCAIGIHSGCHNNLGLDRMNKFTGVHAAGHMNAQVIAFTSLFINGVFDRFPNIRFGFLEGGAEWIMPIMGRLDRDFADSGYRDFKPRVDLGGKSPSEYVQDHIKDGRIFIGCEGNERFLSHIIGWLGNPFMYSSDLSHEVTEEDCRREIDEVREHTELSQGDKEAILYGNAERFYNL